jgi:hypothetical protein
MRTTLDIDDDVLGAVKELAAHEKTTAGKVLSDLVRKALCPPPSKKYQFRNGFPIIPGPRNPVTSEQVRKLLDEEFLD